MLDDEADCALLHGAAERLARADVPPPVVAAIQAGRIVALRKPNGRVRALVVGDVFRRLVGRTLAQEYASELQAACMPFQYGLSTRAGTEALVRLLRVATEMDPRATVLSIDAVGAFDHVSRRAMLAGLQQRPSLQPLLPYVRQFYASDSTYVWQDAQGNSHEVRQSEGGEQGDPLMPALYAIEANTQLHEGEAVFAYTLTTFMLSRPLSESASCKTLANESSTSMRTSNSIAARPASGMQRVRNQQTFLTCAATAKSPCGLETGLSPAIAKVSSSSARRLVRTSTLLPSSLPRGKRSNVFSPASLMALMCQICRLLGCCCISAPLLGLITSCAMCRPHSQPVSLRPTMPPLRPAWALSCIAVIQCQPPLYRLRSSP